MSYPVSYYLNLITSEHRDKPNFIAWLTAFIQPLDDASSLSDLIGTFYDIDTAIGVQLDTLGESIGQGRQVNFQPTNGGSPILNDNDYRVLLKAKIVKNQWKGLIQTLQPVWQVLFPGGALIVKDNQDMTMDVYIGGTFTLTMRDLVRNGYMIPKPAGVRVNYYFGDIPFFGFDLSNQFIAGFDTGKWEKSQEVPIFAFDLDTAQYKGFDQGFWTD